MTKVHVHKLTGLKPDALATYLAGLGVFRLLAEQRDAEVRAFWRDESLVLVTTLDRAEIETFFVSNYAPTPILAPWNMDSGFFSLKPIGDAGTEAGEVCEAPGAGDATAADGNAENDEAKGDDDGEDETKDAVGDPLLERLEGTTARRFKTFGEAIRIARQAISEDLRRAEESVRRVHAEIDEEIRLRSTPQREAFERACRDLEDAKRNVEEAKALVEETKAAAKGAPRGARAREQLKDAQQHLKELQARETAVRKETKAREKELKEAKRRAASDPALKERIAEAKKSFKDLQSQTKEQLIADLRARWGGEGQQWIDAAVVLDESGAAAFTSLFGSGGNDGRMEFTKNFRYHLDALFDLASGAPRDDAGAKLHGTLFAGASQVLSSRAVGQFYPGRAGGTNMAAGFEGGAAVNSWEFVLMLEGAVALVSGMSRRGEVGRARASSPFWVEAAAAGFGSASAREGSPRGEQWLPLWAQPLRYSELVELLREGRAQVGRQQTTRAADLVRATARLGLARGIDSLQRFAYLERNGQSNLAVFTGRFHVRSRLHQELLDDVAPWIEALVWHAKQTKENNVPASLGTAARRAQEALFSVCRREGSPRDWRDLLIALGEAELVLLRSGKSLARRPLPPLSVGWIAAVDDSTREGRLALRLALAFASQHQPVENEKGELFFRESIRLHFMPLRDRSRFDLDERGRPKFGPEQVCVGRDLVADAIALVERRSVWARSLQKERKRTPRLPLQAMPGCEATLEEIGAWIRSEVSDQEVLGLARALMALDWTRLASGNPVRQPTPGGVPVPLHLLARLAHLPFGVPVADSEGKIEANVEVRLDPEPLRRLAAGDFDGAFRVTIRRLQAHGFRPVFRRAVATPNLARRLAASLAFPISRPDAARAARLICKPYDVQDVDEQPAVPA